MPLRISCSELEKNVMGFINGTTEMKDVKSESTNMYTIAEMCQEKRLDLAVKLCKEKNFSCIHADAFADDFLSICSECSSERKSYRDFYKYSQYYKRDVTRIIGYMYDDIEKNNISLTNEDKTTINDRLSSEKSDELKTFIKDQFPDIWRELNGYNNCSFDENCCMEYDEEDIEEEEEEEDWDTIEEEECNSIQYDIFDNNGIPEELKNTETDDKKEDGDLYNIKFKDLRNILCDTDRVSLYVESYQGRKHYIYRNVADIEGFEEMYVKKISVKDNVFPIEVSFNNNYYIDGGYGNKFYTISCLDIELSYKPVYDKKNYWE